MLKIVSEDKFKENVRIRFNNISEGFNKYYNGILQGNTGVSGETIERSMISFIEKAFELNGTENSYVDFYYSRLGEEDKKRLEEMLSVEDREILKELKEGNLGDGIYFILTKQIISFITRLSTREILFSTIYFTKVPCTIWGNYDLKFPCFFESNEDMEKYKEISNEFDLKII